VITRFKFSKVSDSVNGLNHWFICHEFSLSQPAFIIIAEDIKLDKGCSNDYFFKYFTQKSWDG